jgi:hypothetical protein
MAYIGKQPTVGNFVKLDAITTSATTTFNLTNGGVAYSPQSANHCIVSLNGVIQSPNTSFTISGSTIVFASALTSSDVIDFILVLGDVLNIGTPSDATVGFSKITSNLITGATAETSIAGGDSILIYDDSATALRKMTRTNFVAGIGGTNTPAFEATKSSYQTVTDETVTKLQANTETFDTDGCYDNATNYRFTPTTAGKYFVYLQAFPEALALNCLFNPVLRIRKNGSTDIAMSFVSNNSTFSSTQPITVNAIIDMNGSTDYLEPFGYVDVTVGNTPIISGIRFGAYKLIGA